MSKINTFPSHSWRELGEYLSETRLLESVQNALYWDQNTIMPFSGASWRGKQLSFLAKFIHQRQSSERYQELLNNAKNEDESSNPISHTDSLGTNDRLKNLELLEKEYVRRKSIDPDLVAQIAINKAEGYSLWQEAKAKNDFDLFSPALKRLISLRQEEANQLSEPRSCWETLAQPFEPDLSKSRLNELFEPLRKRLPVLIEKFRDINNNKTKEWDLSIDDQKQLCEKLLNAWGRDINVTSMATSPHPFSITLGPNDFRITTRVVKGQPFSCFLATAHEWGHSLYEQGLPFRDPKFFPWPIGQATSMAVHESQSLFWENRVARSLPFSERFWNAFEKAGAPISSGVDLWRELNPISPGLNRVEADELSYGLHIIIRTELELSLLEEGMSTEDLPTEWDKRYEELLGVKPPNNSQGCLQDVHWSEGMFGYFPSYLIGHLISAQFSESMEIDLKSLGIDGLNPIDTCIRESKEEVLVTWLREKVHSSGRRMNAEELVREVTGKNLSCDSFLNYLESKLERLASVS